MTDQEYMLIALEEAKKAFSENEVPIGAVIVKDDKVIAKGYNRREQDKNVLAHAEIEALNEACAKLNRWILDDCTIYVTCEPCLMCAGAISQARIKNIVYGIPSPKYGVFESVDHVGDNKKLFFDVNIKKGIEEEKIKTLMQEFFKKLR